MSLVLDLREILVQGDLLVESWPGELGRAAQCVSDRELAQKQEPDCARSVRMIAYTRQGIRMKASRSEGFKAGNTHAAPVDAVLCA